MFKIETLRTPRAAILALLAPACLTLPAQAQKIGSRLTVSTGGDTERCAVSYSAFASEYLVIWVRHFSGHDQIRAQRLGADGSYKGSTIAISVGFEDKAAPCVAYVHKSQRWLVAWQEKSAGKWSIRGRTLAPGSGAMSLPIELVGGPVDVVEPALAGDRSAQDDDAILAWRVVGGGIRTREVTVPALGLPSMGSAQLVTANTVDREPALSPSGGALRRHVLSWTRENGASDNIYAKAINADGQPLGNELAVSAGNADDGGVTIAGDGERFFVAWQRRNTSTGNGEVFGRMLAHDGSKISATASSIALTSEPGKDSSHPAVAYLSGKFTIAWSQQNAGSDYDIAFRMFDPSSQKACGGQQSVVGLRSRDGYPAIASQYAGSANSDRAMLGFVSEDPANSRGILHAQRFEATGPGGSVVDLGGGCGLGGQLNVKDSLAVGNPIFGLELTGASAASSIAIFNITSSAPPVLSCGGCEIANPLLLIGAPLVAGASSLQLPIPCDTALGGGSVDFQCLVLGSASSPCVALPGYAFSNRLRGTIGQ